MAFIHTIYNTIIHAIRYFIAPAFCVHCKRFLPEATIVCASCDATISPISSYNLMITQATQMQVFAIADYKGLLKNLILAKKRSDRLASKQLAQLIWSRTSISQWEFDYITYVPLHWTRYAHRGYNQAQVMAHVLAQKSGKPVAHLLKRHKRTQFQLYLDVAQRRKNLSQAIVLADIDYTQYTNKRILIVDDLMTTGATLQAAAKALMPLKAASITAVVGCRVV